MDVQVAFLTLCFRYSTAFALKIGVKQCLFFDCFGEHVLSRSAHAFKTSTKPVLTQKPRLTLGCKRSYCNFAKKYGSILSPCFQKSKFMAKFPRIYREQTSGMNLYAPPKAAKGVTAVADHLCPYCHSPIYDRKPVCGVCFAKGLFKKAFWKRNRPVLHYTRKKTRRFLKSSFSQKAVIKIKKPPTESELLRKMGSVAYFVMKRAEVVGDSSQKRL